MAIGQRFGADANGVKTAARSLLVQVKKNPVQFALAVVLVMMCGATKKFQTFPMPWVAGQSKCKKPVTELPFNGYGRWNRPEGISYAPIEWMKVDANCEEKAKVFTFSTERFTITTAYLVFFGVTKAVFNFVTGVCCDRFGRKWTLTVGWALGLPMPFMVLYAGSWWTAAFSNVFLGMQQALVWSATIFIMVDYLGQNHSGAAIGLNETVGYTTVAIAGVIAAAILDEDDPRGANYWTALGLMVVGLLIGATVLKDSKGVSVEEEADMTSRQVKEVEEAKEATFVWPSKRESTVSIPKASFVYTSFMNNSLMSICVAGLMINFTSGFAWGLFAKWMKNDYEVDGVVKWEGFSKETVAAVTLCYGLPKGVLQMFFGFLGDRIGRKWLIVAGLAIVALGEFVMSLTGAVTDDPLAGFYIGAVLLGIGTGVMYTNNLAAICDHSDSSWRATALGAYRFWRDMGYAVGALLTGLFADGVGIGGSVAIAGCLTVLSAVFVAVAYQEVIPEGKKEVEEVTAAPDTEYVNESNNKQDVSM